MGLKVHTRESVRKSRNIHRPAGERDRDDVREFRKFADNRREEGPLLSRGWKGVWELKPDKPLRKPTS